MTLLLAVIVGVAVAIAVLVLVSRSRRSRDGVDSFRRQIDALSTEARRPVIDQMYDNSDRPEPSRESRFEPRPADGVASDAAVSRDPVDAGDDIDADTDDADDVAGSGEDGGRGA